MDREEMLAFLKEEAKGIATMFGPKCETLVHDMTRPGHPILAIYNGNVTGREVGSTMDIFGDIGNYSRDVHNNQGYVNQMVLTKDGRMLKSSTFLFNDEEKGYCFAIGINFDITEMARVTQVITELAATSGELKQTIVTDAMGQIEEILKECISLVGKEPRDMQKSDRVRIIRMLYKKKAFTYQKAVAIVAERLRVSRYTVYKYMHEIEKESENNILPDA